MEKYIVYRLDDEQVQELPEIGIINKLAVKYADVFSYGDPLKDSFRVRYRYIAHETEPGTITQEYQKKKAYSLLFRKHAKMSSDLLKELPLLLDNLVYVENLNDLTE